MKYFWEKSLLIAETECDISCVRQNKTNQIAMNKSPTETHGFGKQDLEIIMLFEESFSRTKMTRNLRGRVFWCEHGQVLDYRRWGAQWYLHNRWSRSKYWKNHIVFGQNGQNFWLSVISDPARVSQILFVPEETYSDP